MKETRIDDLVRASGASLLSGSAQVRLRGVSTDTRTIQRGEFFFALCGPNFDGARFALDALERGASGVLLQDAKRLAGKVPANAVVLDHSDPRRALQDFARHYRSQLACPVIGITGSCGKTTTKTILLDLLGSRLSVAGSPASFNNDIGVPLTLFRADAGTEALVVEMGTNGKGEIAALASIARPTVGMVTTVGFSHLAGLGSIEGVAHEKADLVRMLPREGVAVLNADNRWTAAMARETDARVVTYSLEGAGDLNARDIRFENGHTHLTLEGYEISSPLLGLHNVHNLLAALAACQAIGLPWPEVLPAVSRLKPAQRRMEQHELDGFTLIDDSYNANPESARASVRVLRGMHGFRRRVLVLGDMLELGELSPELHKSVGEYAAEGGIDVLLLVGELTAATAAGALEAGFPADQLFHVASTEEAIARAAGIFGAGDVVLVKGSRRTGLDRLVTQLVQAHKQRQEVRA
jgi:UDP-N-acetylmuramoyl-tripeptide--D-alanyl-D-alanine ligase